MLPFARFWLAGKRSEEYDDKPPQVNVGLGLSIGELHLDALQRMGHTAKHAPELEREADYELIEESEPQSSSRSP